MSSANKTRIRNLVVGQFFRKRGAGAFSVERLFEDVRLFIRDKVTIKIFENPFPSSGFLNRILNIIYASFQKCDVNHITGDTHFLNLFMRRNVTVLTVLDCIMMERLSGIKRYIFWFFWLWLPEKKCKVITVISHSTKQELLKYIKCDPSKIRIIPCCVSREFKYSKKVFCKNFPSILQVGTFPNKNIERLILALKGIQCELVIVGELTHEHLVLLAKNEINYSNYVGLSRTQLLRRYTDADIVAFVSTYEGFGLPIIEANVVGRVVVTSNISSMPEVANGSACLVNPLNVNDIRQGILRVINDDEYREKLILQGRSNAKRFDVGIVARQYLELYEELGRGSMPPLGSL